MTSVEEYHGYVGTFTDGESEGIYAYRIDGRTGALDQVGSVESANPSFLARHPTGEYLYAANNVDDGTVTAFAVNHETGELARLDEARVGDDGPCHCSVDATGRYVLTAQYAGGSVSMLPLAADGSVCERSHVVQHSGSSVDPDRQADPHPHSIVPGPNNEYAYVPDLGTDQVAVYELALDVGRLRPAASGHVDVHDGAGPRHLEFHPNGRTAYLANELDSTLVAFDYDDATGTLDEFATVETVPGSVDVENYPADVHVHPSGDVVYCSNRGHDSIAVFELDGRGRPRLVDTVSTRGEWPRHFALDTGGDFLFAENQHTGNVLAYRIEDDGGLTPTGDEVDVPQPVCLTLFPP